MKNYERFIISIIWSLASIFFIGFILVEFGDKMEILTLIIGLVGGTIIGSIFGHYFSSQHKNVAQEEVVIKEVESPKDKEPKQNEED
jgi:hypothetical protein